MLCHSLFGIGIKLATDRGVKKCRCNNAHLVPFISINCPVVTVLIWCNHTQYRILLVRYCLAMVSVFYPYMGLRGVQAVHNIFWHAYCLVINNDPTTDQVFEIKAPAKVGWERTTTSIHEKNISREWTFFRSAELKFVY